jgi:phospholipid/cholesterol/gamma-HCH transport system substrate-binding protein
MNERVMQFRIGMFVIVAGLVLTMLIVWFGESPALFRDRVYVVVHFLEAPGVAEGIPVRKSGIRVGEVTAIAFDDRPHEPDGVLVTLALDPKYKIKTGSVPRVSRSLIGDVAIDLLPGTGPGMIATSINAAHAPIIEGTVAPDPAKALAAASEAFEKAGGTLASIDQAAKGIAAMTQGAKNVGDLMNTWNETGKQLSTAASGIDRFIKDNEGNIQPALTNVRDVARKLNTTLDPKTQESLKSAIQQFNSAAGRLDTSLTHASPFFNDLGAPVTTVPKTDFGLTVRQLNLIARDVRLLTQALSDGQGKLNPNGSLQKMVLRGDLYDNINRMTTTVTDTFNGFRPVLALLRIFAEKISRDPSLIARGALQR